MQKKRVQLNPYLNENEYTKQNIFVSMQSAVTHNADDSVTMDTYLVVPESTEDFSSYIELKNRVSKEELQMSNDGVIITEKISMKLGLNVGDHVTFRVDDKKISSAHYRHYGKLCVSLYLYAACRI